MTVGAPGWEDVLSAGDVTVVDILWPFSIYSCISVVRCSHVCTFRIKFCGWYMFWKNSKQICHSRVKETQREVFVLYLDHEEMGFDRAVIFLFNRLERICLSPTWFMNRWLLLIALKMWISWDSLFTASAVAKKPINYSAKKPWKVKVPPAIFRVGRKFNAAWV